MKRREVLKWGAALAAAGWAGGPGTAQAESLEFNPAAFQELTTQVWSGGREVKIRYQFWKAVPYVARPVDVRYQSLNVSVPVEIDGQPLDASKAPILLANSIGGYMPSLIGEAAGVGEHGMVRPAPEAPAGGRRAPHGPPQERSSTWQGGGPPRGLGDFRPPEGGLPSDRGGPVSLARLGLAAGLVVVEPGARGRNLKNSAGRYIGSAPAAIVDLKAAVRWIRANRSRLPGRSDWIVSTGTSAGGALSALLGASGDSPLYAAALKALGAASESDTIFAAGAWCPITDLEHADMAYEWAWGGNPLASGENVDAALSTELRSAFVAYQKSLGLSSGGQTLTADTLREELLSRYLRPAAARFLEALTPAERDRYLAAHPWVGTAFSWNDFLAHVGSRKKSLPAFDDFNLGSGENNLFADGDQFARHFTPFSARHVQQPLDRDISEVLRLMNPMGFLLAGHAGRCRHWWLRVGAQDTDTSPTVVANLAAAAQQLGDDVDARFYWDAGHGANQDPEAFLAWVGRVTGYRATPRPEG